MTGYLNGEEFYIENGVDYHKKHYEFDDIIEFKVESKKYSTSSLSLNYNTRDNICCIQTGYIKNGVYNEHTLKCVGVNPIGVTTDEMDLEIFREHISSKLNTVSLCEEEPLLDWDD